MHLLRCFMVIFFNCDKIATFYFLGNKKGLDLTLIYITICMIVYMKSVQLWLYGMIF